MIRVLPMRLASRIWPDGVVDLMRAGMEQVFALEINFRAAEFPGQSFRKIERRGAAAEFACR